MKPVKDKIVKITNLMNKVSKQTEKLLYMLHC